MSQRFQSARERPRALSELPRLLVTEEHDSIALECDVRANKHPDVLRALEGMEDRAEHRRWRERPNVLAFSCKGTRGRSDHLMMAPNRTHVAVSL